MARTGSLLLRQRALPEGGARSKPSTAALARPMPLGIIQKFGFVLPIAARWPGTLICGPSLSKICEDAPSGIARHFPPIFYAGSGDRCRLKASNGTNTVAAPLRRPCAPALRTSLRVSVPNQSPGIPLEIAPHRWPLEFLGLAKARTRSDGFERLTQSVAAEMRPNKAETIASRAAILSAWPGAAPVAP